MRLRLRRGVIPSRFPWNQMGRLQYKEACEESKETGFEMAVKTLSNSLQAAGDPSAISLNAVASQSTSLDLHASTTTCNIDSVTSTARDVVTSTSTSLDFGVVHQNVTQVPKKITSILA